MKLSFVKRFVVAFLCILSLPLSYTANGVGSTADREQPEDALSQAEDILLSDWFNYLQTEEHQCSDMLWILDYADDALESSDWSKLQRFFAVLETASLYLAAREIAKPETTDEQYSLLADTYGLDIYAVNLDTSGIRTDYLADAEVLRNDFQIEFFLKPAHDAMRENLDCLRTQYTSALDYDAGMTAYLLKLLGRSENTERLRTYIHDYLPQIDSRIPSDKLSVSEIEAFISGALDRLESAVIKQKELQGVQVSNLELFDYALNRGESAMLADHSAPISGLTDTLPAPEWYFGSTTTCSWLLDNGDSHRLPNDLERVSEDPTVLHITSTDAKPEDLILYTNLLESCGYSGVLKEEDSLKYYLFMENWNMAIIWDGTAITMDFFGHLPCLAPSWYKAQ